MKIIDNNNLLTPSQDILLRQSAAIPFRLRSFSSLDDILTTLKVDVIIELGIYRRTVPTSLSEVEDFWREEANRIERENHNEDSCNDYQEPSRKREEACKEKELYAIMPLRGLYDSENNIIKLFPEEMVTEYNGCRMEELLVCTLAHETMHAYFNRPRHKSFPYVHFVEEPLAEFGMLLYLNDTNSPYMGWAHKDVSNKRTCYRYGAVLFDQYNNGDVSLRQYLEDYKVRLEYYDMPTIPQNGGAISMPIPSKRNACGTVVVNGNTINVKWNDVFRVPPRYFWDNTTKTLGLDGDWNFEKFWDYRRFNTQNVYLGDDFTFNGTSSCFSKLIFSVSPKNREFTERNGIPVFKSDGKPALISDCNGYYDICRNGKWGVIDEQLNQIIPCIYEDIWLMDSNGLFMVRDNNLYGLVDANNNVVVPIIYEDLSEENGNYEVELNGQKFMIDKFGNKI